MFLFDEYTGEAEFRLNVHITKYVIISPEGLPADIPALNFEAMDASFANWESKKPGLLHVAPIEMSKVSP